MEAAVNGHTQWAALGEVEPVLQGLWAKLAEERAAAGAGVLPAVRRLNLVVLTKGARQAERAASIIEALAESFPARAIILVEQIPGDRIQEPREFEERGRPPARVTIRCTGPGATAGKGVTGNGPGSGGSAGICYEEVLIPARSDDAPLLQGFVEPLLLGDIPVALWVPQEPDCAAQDFRRVATLAERVVLDSAAFAQPVRGLRLMANLVREMSGRTTLGDLSWARLTPWREMVAELFEDQDRRWMLERIETVAVSYGSEVVDSELAAGGEERLGPAVSRALLFCGWLATRLGWMMGGRGWRHEGEHAVLEMRRAGVGNTPGATIALRLHPHRCLPGQFGGLETVTLEVGPSLAGEPGAVLTVKRTPETGVCSSRLRRGDREVEVRTVDMPLPSEESLLAEELASPAEDTVFEEALALAAELSALPGSEGLQVQ